MSEDKTMYPLKVIGDCDPEELTGTKVYFPSG